MKFIIHTDGGARGNPGPAAIGVVIEEVIAVGDRKTREIVRFGKKIGETTNNVAEYTAVIEALLELKTQFSGLKNKNEKSTQFYLDSSLVANQLRGLFKIKEPHLRELLMKIRELEQELGGEFNYNYVPREQNRKADFLVNQALDNP